MMQAMEGTELTNRQTRVLGDVAILYYTKSFQEAIDITEEGKAVAEEMLGTNTRLSADSYRMLGESWDECGEYVGAQGLLEKEVLQRHDLVTILGARPFKYEGQQNFEILDQGFKMPELTAGGDEEKEAVAGETSGNGPGEGGAGKEEDAPAAAIPVAT